MLTNKINYDDIVFGDFQHIKVDNSKIFECWLLPENSEEFDDIQYNFNDFGLLNLDVIRLFIDKKQIQNITTRPFTDLMGSLIVLPSEKIMEITDINFMVPGLNNLFSQSDEKNVYKFTCKPYHKKSFDSKIPEIENNDLVKLYNELSNDKDQLENEAKVNKDNQTKVPVVTNPIDDVFGRF